MVQAARNPQAAALSIGDLAAATGVSVPTLRMWEQRHGFPVAVRLPSGHRRYHADDVELVRRVAEQRAAGLRLEQAVARVRRSAAPPDASVFAELRHRNPGLPVHRLGKDTLVAMSWAIEDEFVVQARRPRLYGAFQRAEFYAASRGRWRDLARRCASATVLADFPESDPVAAPGTVRRAALADDSPLHGEWAVVCDAEDLSVVLSAWEVPGQDGLPDARREFEAVWSLRPADVAAAARTCAAAAGEPPTGTDGPLLRAVPAEERGEGDPAAAAALFARVVAYVDRRAR
ncbi:MerR family transcriptional regulator [Nocardioides sp. ChNu-153]|uniref:DICT sensory domain-containing protein n=1 Tax=unclassified Nocardioides TaxID=2615069 RepID=UPI002407752E|nr:MULTISPECIES: DICT sensory domain-containing protein [unclassified Nocardioides]MDF9716245.1 MerR family transcriptional regulator [Nocardioides sp. ChNu-99]MDN7122013.1 MerR family transcriptional regulator [Nocardioides sp. ChNu-153]